MLPFLQSQKLYILKPGVDSRAAVHPEQFHAARRQSGEGRGDEPDGDSWTELPRADLLAGSFSGQNLHRLALTTDAGLGKTYNLKWLRHELNVRDRGFLAIVLPVGKLTSPADLIDKLLVPEIRNAPWNHHEDPRRLRTDLEELRGRGRLVLLFDGLDMAGDDSVKALVGLLEPNGEWARCRIVVAGRPFALERNWDQVFAGKAWQFVQIGELVAKQQRAALGKLPDGRDRYDSIPPEARNILTIPRVVEYLQPLGAEQLGRLKTVADVYWQACCYMLWHAPEALGQEVKDEIRKRHVWERFLALLGALAFTMYARTERHAETGELRPNLDRILPEDMTEFLYEVLGRLEKVLPRYSEAVFWGDLDVLNQLNAGLNHGWLDVGMHGWLNVGMEGGCGEALLWRNASLQEFFAAYWVTRWGDETDSQRLREWLVDPMTDVNRGFYWFWRYASEMPDEAVSPGSRKPPASWQNAMSPLYDGTIVDRDGPIRSTEFIYRGWKRMEQWNAGPLQNFRKQFQEIPAEKKPIAEKMLQGFIRLPGGRFQMGSPEGEKERYGDERQHWVILSSFRIHKFCVTNEEYELFDRRHQSRRWGKEEHPLVKEGGPSADDQCPVVNVSWYDAWTFARWTGVRLPSEAEWEYSCRGGADFYEVFHYGNSLSSHQANFDGDYPYGGADEGPDLGHTTPVKAYEPNRFGLYDMHGNVWEWCADWYAAASYPEEGEQSDPVNEDPASARVLRGGSWGNDGRYCRSAHRHSHEPDYRHSYYGFRLAAVPASLEPSQAGQEAERRERSQT